MNYTVCQACLKRGNDVVPMSAKQMELYYCFLNQVSKHTDMSLCIYCSSFLTKLGKFIDQCRKAQILLSQVNQETILPLLSYNHMLISPLKSFYIGPDCDQNLDSDLKAGDLVLDNNSAYITEDDDKVQLVLLCGNNGHPLNNNDVTVKMETPGDNETVTPLLKHVNLSRSPMKTYYLGPDHDQDADPDMRADDSAFECAEPYVTEDEDELPLVLFRESDAVPAEDDDAEVKTERHIVKEDIIKTDSNMKLEEKPARSERKKKKQKKVLREGFTSRMVQETTEYTVIKLSKEQVLEEMLERSKSDKYLRAPYKCESCVKGFNFEDVLQSHMGKHSPENGPLVCEVCSQRCPSAVSMRGHMKSHSTRYRCKVCGYARRSRQHVLEHHATAHAGAPAAYSCALCNFTTGKRTVMQRHVRATHTHAEPHACHKCGKLYKSIDSLRVHTVRHENSKRYQCEQCELSFAYPTLLRKHVRSVHAHRDYYCVECDIKFKSMDTLKLHFKRAKRHRDGSYKCETRAHSGRGAVRANARRKHTS